jgi:hypothetical protein
VSASSATFLPADLHDYVPGRGWKDHTIQWLIRQKVPGRAPRRPVAGVGMNAETLETLGEVMEKESSEICMGALVRPTKTWTSDAGDAVEARHLQAGET